MDDEMRSGMMRRPAMPRDLMKRDATHGATRRAIPRHGTMRRVISA
jgi:hypothetical protein